MILAAAEPAESGGMMDLATGVLKTFGVNWPLFISQVISFCIVAFLLHRFAYKPILVVLTLPITVVTLGLFYFVVTAICLWITSRLVDGFAVQGFFHTIIASIAIGLISAVIQSVLKPAKHA